MATDQTGRATKAGRLFAKAAAMLITSTMGMLPVLSLCLYSRYVQILKNAVLITILHERIHVRFSLTVIDYICWLSSLTRLVHCLRFTLVSYFFRL
jgi:hypothetical protein